MRIGISDFGMWSLKELEELSIAAFKNSESGAINAGGKDVISFGNSELFVCRLFEFVSSIVLWIQQGESSSDMLNPEEVSSCLQVQLHPTLSSIFIRHSICWVANEKFDNTSRSDNAKIEYFLTFLCKIIS